MKRKVLDIVERVNKRKALGIIFNVPKDQEAQIQNKLLDDKHLVFRGNDVYTSAMLNFRLSQKLKMKGVSIDMLPSLIDGKVIVITSADILKESYTKVFQESSKYKVPFLLLMNRDHKLADFRKLPFYQHILTIEQNYQTL
jgi:hypothetical protein